MKRLSTLVLLQIVWMATALAQNVPTYSHDVAPIIYNHCTTCHRVGSIAPFPLENYTQVFNNRYSIFVEVPAKLMPPWPPTMDYQRYAHERVLSCDEIQTIVDWVNGGAPEGDPNQTPPEPVFPTGSTLGVPDLTLRIPTYTVPSNQTSDIYQCFVLNTGLTTSKYITAVEAVPGNRGIVHHALIYQDTSSTPVTLDNNDPAPGYTNFGGTGSNSSKLIAGWVPGSASSFLPTGMGIKLAPGARIVVQIHYPNGSAGQSDSTAINLFFAPDTATNIRNVTLNPLLNYFITITDGPLKIPADSIKTFHEHFKMPANLGDQTLLAVAPHMHLIGKKIKAFGVTPAGDTLKLVDIQNWDFHWQGGYNFTHPMRIPAGTDMYAEATYDNTVHNPDNPNSPPQLVKAGEKTTDEMMLVYFTYLPYVAGDENIVIDTAALADTVCHTMIYEGINDVAANQQLQLFDPVPNPANDATTIAFNLSKAGAASISIMDLSGRVVAAPLNTDNLTSGYNSLELNTQKLAPGIYLVRLHVDGAQQVKKLVVNH